MIFRVVVVGRTNLHALRIKAFRYIIVRIPLLRWLWISGNPHELLRARHGTIVFLHNLHALTKAVVPKLTSVRTADDGSQAVQQIPFVDDCPGSAHFQ